MASESLDTLINVFQVVVCEEKMTQTQLLISGIFRQCNSNTIPMDVNNAINEYYPNIQIYGIGLNESGNLGTAHNKSLDLNKYTYLEQLTSCYHYLEDKIYGIDRTVVIHRNHSNHSNDVYVAGMSFTNASFQGNEHTQCNMTKLNQFTDDNQEYITHFMQGKGHKIWFATNQNKFYIFKTNLNQKENKMNDFDAEYDLYVGNQLTKIKANITSFHVAGSCLFALIDGGRVFCFREDYHDEIDKEWICTDYIIKQISCGQSHTLFLDIYGNVICFGRYGNDYGELGLRHNKRIKNECILNTYFEDKNIVNIICNFHNSLCIDRHGNGYIFGSNISSQIGNGGIGQIVKSDDEYEYNDDDEFGGGFGGGGGFSGAAGFGGGGQQFDAQKFDKHEVDEEEVDEDEYERKHKIFDEKEEFDEEALNEEEESYHEPPRLIVSEPYLLPISNIKTAGLAFEHTVILCDDGSFYGFGSNEFHLFSATNTLEFKTPHLLKKQELGLSEKDNIVDVMVAGYNTLLIVNKS